MQENSYTNRRPLSKLSNDGLESPHDNNMVGATTKFDKNIDKNIDKTLLNQHLTDLSKGVRQSRVLVDLLAVSITPKIFDSDDFQILPFEEFMTYFFDFFEGIIDVESDFKEFTPYGGGFNSGRRYDLVEGGSFQVRFFNPDIADSEKFYYSGSAFDNYLRQKVSFQFTGDSLQTLRQKGVFFDFLSKLFKTGLFKTVVTMFDATVDLFNFGISSLHFWKLYLDEKFVSRSTLSVEGDGNNPTLYIGKRKGPRTIMIYDKLAEYLDKGNFDEIEIYEALEKCDGSWLRVEQHFSRDQKEADQLFKSLVDYASLSDNFEDSFLSNLSDTLAGTLANKIRFLKEKKPDSHISRVATDDDWQTILDTVSSTKKDFAFERPLLTLSERKKNFLSKGWGGPNLFADILEQEGETEYQTFITQINYIVQQKILERKKDAD